ncbi:uncharacterized protein LOC119402828 [Rhipicephalus sanguineus]|uniref:uncharacterized protein LOC119402828 n=1 Tax=Rhipicephalus sanguineus TaxID=34632 RepID=UPI0018931D42|nr:uncharacterized protein LOC119402828 [Rhipicephalus sanguineus]
MSYTFGLCCCEACEGRCKRLRSRLPRCLGGEDPPGGLEGLQLCPPRQKTTGPQASSVSGVVTQAPSPSFAVTGRASAPLTCDAGVATDPTTAEASTQTGTLKTVRSSDGTRPIGASYKSSVWCDDSLSYDPNAKLSMARSLVSATTGQPPGEDDKTSDDGSNVEKISAGVGDNHERKQQQQYPSTSELGEQPGNP